MTDADPAAELDIAAADAAPGSKPAAGINHRCVFCRLNLYEHYSRPVERMRRQTRCAMRGRRASKHVAAWLEKFYADQRACILRCPVLVPAADSSWRHLNKLFALLTGYPIYGEELFHCKREQDSSAPILSLLKAILGVLTAALTYEYSPLVCEWPQQLMRAVQYCRKQSQLGDKKKSSWQPLEFCWPASDGYLQSPLLASQPSCRLSAVCLPEHFLMQQGGAAIAAQLYR